MTTELQQILFCIGCIHNYALWRTWWPFQCPCLVLQHSIPPTGFIWSSLSPNWSLHSLLGNLTSGHSSGMLDCHFMEGSLGRLAAAAPGMSHLSNAKHGTLCRAFFVTPGPRCASYVIINKHPRNFLWRALATQTQWATRILTKRYTLSVYHQVDNCSNLVREIMALAFTLTV